jgi:lysophospholipase L1-like esterase
MLGTNDFQSVHAGNARHAAQGIATLVGAIRQAPIEPGMPVPPVLIVAPPPIGTPQGPLRHKFTDAAAKSQGLAAAYAETAAELGCPFYDAAQATSASPLDGVHLDADQHLRLGRAIAAQVAALDALAAS